MNREKLEEQIKSLIKAYHTRANACSDVDERLEETDMFTGKIMSAIDAYTPEIIGEDEDSDVILERGLAYDAHELIDKIILKANLVGRNELRASQRIRAHLDQRHGEKGGARE